MCLEGFANQKRSQHFVGEKAQGRPRSDIMDALNLHKPHMMEFVDITDVTRARREYDNDADATRARPDTD